MDHDTPCFKKVCNFLDKNKELIFFDVGCNIDKHNLVDYTDIILKSSLKIKHIYGFEPLHYVKYEEKYKNNDKVSIIKKALSNKSDKEKFYIPGKNGPSGLSSFYNRKVFKQFKPEHQVIEKNVDCITIDQFMVENDIDYIDFIKIDVEGAELKVLEGAKNALENKKILSGQYEKGGTYKDAGITEEDVKNYLSQYGYETIFNSGDNVVFKLKQ